MDQTRFEEFAVLWETLDENGAFKREHYKKCYDEINFVENEYSHFLLADLNLSRKGIRYGGLEAVKKCIKKVANPNAPEEVLAWCRGTCSNTFKDDLMTRKEILWRLMETQKHFKEKAYAETRL